MTSPQSEPDIIPAEQARAILEQAIIAELGEDWNAHDSKWVIVDKHDYMARLNNSGINMDFYVDYFDGSVKIDMSEVHAGQDTGRLFGVIMLALSAVIVVLLARVLGYL